MYFKISPQEIKNLKLSKEANTYSFTTENPSMLRTGPERWSLPRWSSLSPSCNVSPAPHLDASRQVVWERLFYKELVPHLGSQGNRMQEGSLAALSSCRVCDLTLQRRANG